MFGREPRFGRLSAVWKVRHREAMELQEANALCYNGRCLKRAVLGTLRNEQLRRATILADSQTTSLGLDFSVCFNFQSKHCVSMFRHVLS